MIRASVLLTAILLISGCSLLPTRTVFVCPEIPTIERPELPTVEISELACITDDTAHTLANRERALVEWGMDQEAVISAVRAECYAVR